MGGKILAQEKSLQDAKSELERRIAEGEEKLNLKINENQASLKELLEGKCQVIDQKVKKLQELLEYDVNMLKDIIVNN